jgi:hypothetical protein
MAPGNKPSIPSIYWAANDHELTWKLLGEMGKVENFKVLFGKAEGDEVSPATLAMVSFI